MKLKRCGVCKTSYPPELLSQMHLATPDGGGYTAPVCGICALDLSNQLHAATGVIRSRFTGTIAEGMRQDAIKWRTTHKVGE
jgi:hypothetical protein